MIPFNIFCLVFASHSHQSGITAALRHDTLHELDVNTYEGRTAKVWFNFFREELELWSNNLSEKNHWKQEWKTVSADGGWEGWRSKKTNMWIFLEVEDARKTNKHVERWCRGNSSKRFLQRFLRWMHSSVRQCECTKLTSLIVCAMRQCLICFLK